jgi:hypothetical protein
MDLERGTVQIDESINRVTGKTRTTKTEVTRRIPFGGGAVAPPAARPNMRRRGAPPQRAEAPNVSQLATLPDS